MTSRVVWSLKQTALSFLTLLPVVLGMLLFISLVMSMLRELVPHQLFHWGMLLDTLLGASLGSIAEGHPSVGYIIGAGFLEAGVGLGAVTALIVSWVTVGVVQLPVEILALGRRFALLRNLMAFCCAAAIGLLVPLTIPWIR